MQSLYSSIFACMLLIVPLGAFAGDDFLQIDSEFHHIRNAEPREWSRYHEKAAGRELIIDFELDSPEAFRLLTLRQEGTKQTWSVSLNDREIGKLLRDHNHLEFGLLIPPATLKAGANTLRISCASETPDDIMVGDLKLHREVAELVDDGTADDLAKKRGFRRDLPVSTKTISLQCVEEESGSPLPCRFTIIDEESGALVFIGAESDDNLAVREGVVYALNGTATFTLAGSNAHPRSYRIYCGRGFEYSVASESVTVSTQEDPVELKFALTHEVPTPGLVACDPHLHTFEFDRHGDCTLTERLISSAGEGVELPVSTGHDKHIPYSEEVLRLGADKWMTTVMGCEVTTHLGHFNTFPVSAGAKPAEHKLRPWARIFDNIFATPGVRVCILNHARDVHRGFTPLHPDNFDPASGTFHRGRELRANAMELINSGAQQSDPMQLVHDWFALLKSGHSISPIGSSDSHTVNFAIPGQARTYIRTDDADVSAIDVDDAVDNLLAGRAMVSFGLLSSLEYHADSKEVVLNVSGPSWTTVDTITLFRNGEEIQVIKVPSEPGAAAGVKYSTTMPLSDWGAESGDFICAVATGPGISEGWWRMMPPYQPDEPHYKPYVMGISEALRIK